MALRALILLVATLVLGIGAVAALVGADLAGVSFSTAVEKMLFVIVGALWAVLGIFTDRKPAP